MFIKGCKAVPPTRNVTFHGETIQRGQSDTVHAAGGRHLLVSFFLALFLVAGVLGLILAWAAYHTGSWTAGVAYLRGESIFADHCHMRVSGDGRSTETLVVRNLSSKPVRVVGYNASCSCVHIGGLPFDLRPNGAQTVGVRAGSATDQDVPVIFLTDQVHDAPLRVDVHVIGVRLAPGGRS